MFLSGGRKFIVIPIIFAYFVLLHKTDSAGRKHILRNTIIIVIVFFLLYQIVMKVPAVYETIGYRFEGFFAMFSDQYEFDSSTLKRNLMIERGFEKWLDSPLWGHGFDSFKYFNASSVTGHLYYSHNNYVELLYNQGVVGFVTYYGFYVYMFIMQRRLKNSLEKGFIIGTLGSVLAFECFGITYSVLPIQIMICIAYMRCNYQSET